MPVTPPESALPTSPDPADEPLPERSVVVTGAVLEQGRYSWLWVVPSCPYCGKQHDHFGGPLDGDPQQYVGMQLAARCDRTDRRRLAVEYPSGALWYRLEPLPLDQPAPEPDQLRAQTRG